MKKPICIRADEKADVTTRRPSLRGAERKRMEQAIEAEQPARHWRSCSGTDPPPRTGEPGGDPRPAEKQTRWRGQQKEKETT